MKMSRNTLGTFAGLLMITSPIWIGIAACFLTPPSCQQRETEWGLDLWSRATSAYQAFVQQHPQPTPTAAQVQQQVESKPTLTPGLSRAQMEFYGVHAERFAASEEDRRYQALIDKVNAKFHAGDYQGALKQLRDASTNTQISHHQRIDKMISELNQFIDKRK